MPKFGYSRFMERKSPIPTASENFARSLRGAREDRGMSQERIAKEMNTRGFKFHQSTVNKIETGERKVNVEEAFELAKVVGIPLTLLFEPDDQLPITSAQRMMQITDSLHATGLRISSELRDYIEMQKVLDLRMDEFKQSMVGIKTATPASEIEDFMVKVESFRSLARWMGPEYFVQDFGKLSRGLSEGKAVELPNRGTTPSRSDLINGRIEVDDA